MENQKKTTDLQEHGQQSTQDFLLAVAEMLYMTVQLYRIELTEQVAAFWQEALEELTPEEVRKGFLKYTKSDRCQFPPKPGDIIEKSGWVKPFVDMREQERLREEGRKQLQAEQGRERDALAKHWHGDTAKGSPENSLGREIVADIESIRPRVPACEFIRPTSDIGKSS